MLTILIVSCEVGRLNMVSYGFLPRFLSIIEIPLVTKGDDTNVTRACNNLRFGLRIRMSKALLNHSLLDESFGVLNFLASKLANSENTFIEALVITLVFGKNQFILVVLTLDLVFFTSVYSCHLTPSRYLDDGNGFKINHFFCDSVFLSESFLLLEISKSSQIVGGIAGDTGDNSGGLFHRDGHHRKRIYNIIFGQGSIKREPHKLVTFDFLEKIKFMLSLGEVLPGHVSG
mmetsp:Transcript_24877/g.28398  ORF Transcript_24877/g.28398 Transcript_24877/m.28398 type:complete len:231 (+) Transcript_24877:159-851(+)